MGTFYLGSHRPQWLQRTRVPLFVSHRTLGKLKRLHYALGRWALDSGGFSELSLYGKWETTAKSYVQSVRRYTEFVGGLDFAAIQDWMVEDVILHRTGLTMLEHQRRTVQSYLDLSSLAPEIPWLPVIQGWTIDDYMRCVGLYAGAGVDLRKSVRVGVGTMCRRQATKQAVGILSELRSAGLRIHGFGFKSQGLLQVAGSLESADSLAWSFTARKRKVRMPGCTHANCANCQLFAEEWRKGVLRRLPPTWWE